jgi:hypothetical protein
VVVTVLATEDPAVTDTFPELVREKSNAGGSVVPFETVILTVRSAVVLSE